MVTTAGDLAIATGAGAFARLAAPAVGQVLKGAGVGVAPLWGQVVTAELTDLNVTTAKLADLGVTTAKLAALSVTEAKIADGAVTGLKLGVGAVGGSRIAAGALDTLGHFVDNLLTDTKMNSAIKDGSAATPSLRTLGTGSTQAAAGGHSHTNATLPGSEREWLYRTSNQTIANATDTDLIWTSEASPATAGWWAAGNPTRLVAPRTGTLVVVGRVYWTGNATGVRKVWIRRSDGTVFAETDNPSPGASNFTQFAFALATENVGAYFTLRVHQTSGGNLDVVGGQFYQTVLMAFMLAGN